MRTNQEPREGTGHWRPTIHRISRLLTLARGDLDQQSGNKVILVLEQADNCSCCASQVRGYQQPAANIDGATQTLIGKLSATQVKLGITPHCEINGTPCGKEEL